MTDESIASRWSRRKQAVKDEALEAEKEAAVEDLPEEPEKTEAEILAELNLKDPDDMEAGDDFSEFMNSAVPQRLRNRALRKLWLSNPALANLDELLDYGEDFTNKGGVVEDIVTAYKVGKGFVNKLTGDDEVVADLADTSPKVDSDEIDGSEEIEESRPVNNVRIPYEARAKSPLPTESKPVVTIEASDKLPETVRKRMRFEF
ncbi:DUF3306 domain-containing protein [Candidatus Fermentibacteria bacterium]|nr:MAG: DUF3306 domain-containing protein [Candidatus Fermentibacteria bacterium]